MLRVPQPSVGNQWASCFQKKIRRIYLPVVIVFVIADLVCIAGMSSRSRKVVETDESLTITSLILLQKGPFFF